MGWPVTVNMAAHTLFSLIDLYWIGTLGTDAIAALALAGNILFSMFSLTVIIQTGALAIISRRIGAGQLQGRDGAEGVAAQTMHLSTVIGILIATLGALWAEPTLRLFEASAPVTELATDYLTPMMISFVLLFPAIGLGTIFTASGDTRTPMYVGIASNILNAVLDPFLIFGWGGLPELGVMGAAAASLICQALGLGLLAAVYQRRDLAFPQPGLLRWYGTDAWLRILRVGIPSGLAALARSFSTLFLLKIIVIFGTAGVAAFSITVRALSLHWLYYGALATAISTLTGQALGRGDVNGIRLLIRHGKRLAFAFAFGLGLIYWIWAPEIVALFEQDDPAVHELGSSFIRLLVLVNLATALSNVWAAVMSGAGDTRRPMMISFVANWLIKLPLAYWLAIPLAIGIEGVGLAMAVSIIFEASALLWWYQRKRWMEITV